MIVIIGYNDKVGTTLESSIQKIGIFLFTAKIESVCSLFKIRFFFNILLDLIYGTYLVKLKVNVFVRYFERVKDFGSSKPIA